MSEIKGSIFDAVRELIMSGKEDSYEKLVEMNSESLERIRRMISKIQKVIPDVALSPYVLRALRVLKERQISDKGSIQAAA